MSLPATHEILLFLADANPQVRQLAMANVVSFSVKSHPLRRLLTDPLTYDDGRPVCKANGEPLDVLAQLKALCQDQPLTIHDALVHSSTCVTRLRLLLGSATTTF